MKIKTINRFNAIYISVLVAFAIAPTLSVKIPAMEDYLNHLSRMYILVTSYTNDANPYYQVSWALYPNLAMDAVVPPLAHFVSVETAGKIFFLASQMLIISGAFALEMSVKGRHEISIFAALLILPSMPFALGLVNFEFGTGLSLWGIASWLKLSRLEKYGARAAVHFFFSSVIFLAHFFALGIYGLIILIYELRRVVESPRSARSAVIISLTLACPVILMVFLMFATGATVGENYNEWRYSWKPTWFLLFLNGYSAPLAAGSAGALVTLLLYGALKRNLSLSTDGKWIAFGLLLVFIAMPFTLFGGGLADLRMIVPAFLILPAFITFALRARSFGYFAAAVVIPIILINSSYVSYVWASYQNDYTALKASFRLLRQKSFILVASAPSTDTTLLMDAPMWRAPTLAVYYANAFVSSLYTMPGKQVIEVKPEWRHLDINSKTETYQPPSLATLKIIAEGGKPPSAPQYIRNWPYDYDYLYLLGPHSPNALPNILVEIATDRRFTLYRLRKAISSKRALVR
jgi:hypothetical protein